MKLHPRQQAILDYLIAFKTEHDGVSPTRRQICDACNISSTGVVAHHLRQLERHGLIEMGDQYTRGIGVTGGKWVYEQPEEWTAEQAMEHYILRQNMHFL